MCSIINQLVRPGKVVYSSGCKSRSGREGQAPDGELWAGASNPKGYAQRNQDIRP